MREDPPKNPDLFIKSVYLFLMFQLQLPSKYAPFAAIHLLRLFFHCSKQLLNLSILIPLSISAIFCCHLFHIDKIFFFMQVNKKSCLVTLGKWGRGWGIRVMLFYVKNCWTLSTAWMGALVNHPSWNGQMHWNSLQEKFTEAEHSLSQQRQLLHWYRWIPRTLTYYLPTLQNIIHFWGVPPLVHICAHIYLEFWIYI